MRKTRRLNAKLRQSGRAFQRPTYETEMGERQIQKQKAYQASGLAKRDAVILAH